MKMHFELCSRAGVHLGLLPCPLVASRVFTSNKDGSHSKEMLALKKPHDIAQLYIFDSIGELVVQLSRFLYASFVILTGTCLEWQNQRQRGQNN
jgi:hypothetical protein